MVCLIPGVDLGGDKVAGTITKRKPCKLYIVRVFLGYKTSSLSCHHLSFKNELDLSSRCSLVFLLYSAP